MNDRMSSKLLSLYGTKYNPFRPDVPIEALYERGARALRAES